MEASSEVFTTAITLLVIGLIMFIFPMLFAYPYRKKMANKEISPKLVKLSVRIAASLILAAACFEALLYYGYIKF